MINNIIEIVKDHWQLLLVVLIAVRLTEFIIRFIIKRLFKKVAWVKKVSLSNWIMAVMLLISLSTIIYLTIKG